MSTLYTKVGSSPTQWALAGDAPGTSANWLETTTSALATSWAAAHGNASSLASSTWDAWKLRYLEPVNVGGPGAGFSDVQKFELGQAVTAGVVLVGDKIDETNYSISLEVPEVPGTATGTAEPVSA